MKEEFKNFLKITKDIGIRFHTQGMFLFDRNVIGGTGYLVARGKVVKVPITLNILNGGK